MVKIISWCFYIDKDNENTHMTLTRLPEYLMGLKCNQRAARLWFPEWKLRLYFDEEVKTISPEIWNLVQDISIYGSPEIELVPCRPGHHPMIERYRPFIEEKDGVCIVRDLDSILSKTDADLVNLWLANQNSDLLSYEEYLMSNTMGGGVGIKMNRVKYSPSKGYTKHKNGRARDEPWLWQFLEENELLLNGTSYKTRMDCHGTYYIKTRYVAPKVVTTTAVRKMKWIEEPVLWIVPFYDYYKGLFTETPLDFSSIVAQIRKLRIRPEHVGVHRFHREEIIKKIHTGWCR